jgi:hypothetical protein
MTPRVQGRPIPSHTPENPGLPAWPNIIAWQGRLLALGAPETLPGPAFVTSLIGGRRLLTERVVRPVSACTVTSEFDKKWLAELRREFPDLRPALVGENLMFVPRVIDAKLP